MLYNFISSVGLPPPPPLATKSLSLVKASTQNIYQTNADFGSYNRQKFSISMWCYLPVAPTGADTYTPMAKFFSVGSSTSEFALQMIQGYFRFRTCSSAGTNRTHDATLTIPSGQWFHLFWGYDSTQATAANRMIIRMNGVNITNTYGSSPALNESVGSGTANLTIGRFSAGSSLVEAYNGYIYQPAFFDGAWPDDADLRGPYNSPKNIIGLTGLRFLQNPSINVTDDDVLPTSWTNVNSSTATTSIPPVYNPPRFGAAGTMVAGAGASINVPMPAGTASGNLLILWLQTANEAVSTPAGWTALPATPYGQGTAGAAGAARLTGFYKIAGGSESDVTVTNPGDHVIGVVHRYENVNTGSPFDTSSGNGGNTSSGMAFPNITTTVDECLIINAAAHGIDTNSPSFSGQTNANLVDLTKRTDVSSDTAHGGGIVVITGAKMVAGAVGSTTGSFSGSTNFGRMTIALVKA